jgi:hypothetical protein
MGRWNWGLGTGRLRTGEWWPALAFGLGPLGSVGHGVGGNCGYERAGCGRDGRGRWWRCEAVVEIGIERCGWRVRGGGWRVRGGRREQEELRHGGVGDEREHAVEGGGVVEYQHEHWCRTAGRAKA